MLRAAGSADLPRTLATYARIEYGSSGPPAWLIDSLRPARGLRVSRSAPRPRLEILLRSARRILASLFLL
ncbi:MAG: hypothetical protein A3K68_00845 [Euryarchaeota archaeon RBG_16_68_13]|nr:MAG: hypothetical protein A3K68_00845 [Euryarchaeota archaeon RBG_16_68_13]